MYDENSNNLIAMANQVMNVKDSRWLQLEVCREYQRTKCSRSDTQCKFAHPPPHVEIQNGKVTACYDSIKGRCNRDNPKCKYLHPPQHLKDQLLINGKNTLALKNMLVNQLHNQNPGAAAAGIPQPGIQMVNPLAALGGGYAISPGLQSLAYSPYAYSLNGAATFAPSLVAGTTSPDAHIQFQVNQTPVMNGNGTCASPASMKGVARNDRIEVCREFLRGTCQREECKYAHPGPEVERYPDGTVAICLDFVRAGGNLLRNSENLGSPGSQEGSVVAGCSKECRSFHPPAHLLQAWIMKSPTAAGLLIGAPTSTTTSSGHSQQSGSSSKLVSGQSAPSPSLDSRRVPVRGSSTPSSLAASFSAAQGHPIMSMSGPIMSMSGPVMHGTTPGGMRGQTPTPGAGLLPSPASALMPSGLHSAPTSYPVSSGLPPGAPGYGTPTAGPQQQAFLMAQAAAAQNQALANALAQLHGSVSSASVVGHHPHGGSAGLQASGMQGLTSHALMDQYRLMAFAAAQSQNSAHPGFPAPITSTAASSLNSALAAAAAVNPLVLAQSRKRALPVDPADKTSDTLQLLANYSQQQQAAVLAAAATNGSGGAVKRAALESKSGVPMAYPQPNVGAPPTPTPGTPTMNPVVSQQQAMALAQLQHSHQLAQLANNPYASAGFGFQTLGLQPGAGYFTTAPIALHSPPTEPLPVQPSVNPPANNVASVAYFDESGQLLDTLPVCRDYKQGHCERPNCRYVHLTEDYVEVSEGKVTVCRDYAKGKCGRPGCKYYHVPVLQPSGSVLSRLVTAAPQQPSFVVPASTAYILQPATSTFDYFRPVLGM